MKKFFTVTALAAMAGIGSYAQADPVYDFTPTILNEFFQEVYDSKKECDATEVRIDVKFDEDVYWVSGFSAQCYLLDSNNEKYDEWWPDFGGLSDDYSKFYFGVRGLNKYVDANYTLVIPQGLLGNPTWYTNNESGRSNPELRYEFNPWKLAGEPREDKTVYDFDPISTSTSLEEVRIQGQKQLELQLALDFSEAVAIYSNVNDKWNVRDSEGNFLSEAIIRAWVPDENPSQVIVGIRGIDLKTSADYTVSIWQGAFGTLEWAAEDYCGGRSNSPLSYVVNPKSTAIEEIEINSTTDSPVYNLHGIKIEGTNLQKGIYIRDGKKFVVK